MRSGASNPPVTVTSSLNGFQSGLEFDLIVSLLKITAGFLSA